MIVSRQKNLLRDFISEMKHEPIAVPSLVDIDAGPDIYRWDQEPIREKTTPRERRDRRDDPVEQAIVNEFLDRLPQRHRQMVLLRMAGYTDSEIADELGLSLRTIEREFSQLRKETKDEFDK